MVAIGGLGLTALTGAAVLFLIKRYRGSKKTSDSHSLAKILDEASSTSKVSPRIPRYRLKHNSQQRSGSLILDPLTYQCFHNGLQLT